MVSTLILDPGNVICEWNPEKQVAVALTNEHGHGLASQPTVGYPDWLELDRGTIKLDNAIASAQ